ncbi:MAG TPA: hypothetical protein VFJ07_01600 [Streptosporangiaceae bacterium]|nr:hypothetical protein [Streptosporangiaceae bacterium]
MTKPAAGPRGRRRGDVMELLARARPASLDPGQGGPRPAEAAARLAAAHCAPAENAAADRATADREAAGHAGTGPVAVRPHRRIPRVAVLTGTGLTAAAVAVAVAVLAVSAGGQGGTGGVAARGGTRAPVLLTAAMVRQVASASRSALALSGRATISYRNTQAGKLQVTGTDRITFSGKNWNDAFSQSFPASDGQPASTQSAINRIVGKQFYLYIKGRTNKLEWYRDTNPSGHPGFTIPDPRRVFSMLEPSARFEFLGYQAIDGIRLKHLRATDLSHLRGLSTLPDLQPGAPVTALEVWVDGHNVVHRLSLTAQTINTVYPAASYNVRRTRHGRLIVTVPNKAMAAQLQVKLKKAHTRLHMTIRIAPPGAAAPRHEVQVTALTVTFSGIGQPQRITAPAHAIAQYGRG